MRFVFIVYPETREEEVRSMLDAAGAGGWTEFRHLIGRGSTGQRLGSTIWPGQNGACLAAVSDDTVDKVTVLLRESREVWEATHKAPFNVHAYVMPCEQLV